MLWLPCGGACIVNNASLSQCLADALAFQLGRTCDDCGGNEGAAQDSDADGVDDCADACVFDATRQVAPCAAP